MHGLLYVPNPHHVLGCRSVCLNGVLGDGFSSPSMLSMKAKYLALSRPLTNVRLVPHRGRWPPIVSRSSSFDNPRTSLEKGHEFSQGIHLCSCCVNPCGRTLFHRELPQRKRIILIAVRFFEGEIVSKLRSCGRSDCIIYLRIYHHTILQKFSFP